MLTKIKQIHGPLYIDTATSYFISYCFALVIASADIIFYNFLELYSTAKKT